VVKVAGAGELGLMSEEGRAQAGQLLVGLPSIVEVALATGISVASSSHFRLLWCASFSQTFQ
jgi:hypothetical protein